MVPIEFPFLVRDPAVGTTSLAPLLPVKLSLNSSLSTLAFLDTGASVNVLPYTLGLQLGADWDSQVAAVKLTGNLAAIEARVLIMWGQVDTFSPVQLVFAWAKTDDVPLIFGQINFFVEFDVCFFRSRATFEIQPATRP